MTSSISFASMPGTKSVTESIDRRQSASTRWPSLLQRSCSASSDESSARSSGAALPSAVITVLHLGKSTSGPPLTRTQPSASGPAVALALALWRVRKEDGMR